MAVSCVEFEIRVKPFKNCFSSLFFIDFTKEYISQLYPTVRASWRSGPESDFLFFEKRQGSSENGTLNFRRPLSRSGNMMCDVFGMKRRITCITSIGAKADDCRPTKMASFYFSPAASPFPA